VTLLLRCEIANDFHANVAHSKLNFFPQANKGSSLKMGKTQQRPQVWVRKKGVSVGRSRMLLSSVDSQQQRRCSF